MRSARSSTSKTPIKKEALEVKALFFIFENEEPYTVAKGDMNLAGMAFMEFQAAGARRLHLGEAFRKEARTYFPHPDDCSRDRRSLVYGALNAVTVELMYE